MARVIDESKQREKSHGTEGFSYLTTEAPFQFQNTKVAQVKSFKLIVKEPWGSRGLSPEICASSYTMGRLKRPLSNKIEVIFTIDLAEKEK